MRGDAALGHLMHIARADLYLDAPAAAIDHGRMDRGVAIALGIRDVILETTRHRDPTLMDDAQRAVTLRDRVREDAKPGNI